MKGDAPYLVHICDRCERIMAIISGITEEEFYQSFRDQDAVFVLLRSSERR